VIVFFTDQVAASGLQGINPVSSSTTNSPQVLPLICGDNNACTSDTCDPATGCVNTPISCGDNNACTSDSCDPATGCVNTPISCGDNNACTSDSCDPASGCVNTPISCGDNNACTSDSCDSINGCQNPAISCDDNDACTIDSCDPATGCVHDPDPTCVPAPGRMTGGGSIFTKAGGRVTHGFELHCDPEIGPNNLEINWGPGNHFHLEELLTAVCTDDPAIVPRPPSADFDTFNGTGTGTCNGVEGATITFVLTDAGEPGKLDFASFEITGCPGGLTLSVSGNLNKGNQQAHKD